MKIKYITITDYTYGFVKIIKFTPEEIEESNKPEYDSNFEDFVRTLESKYYFDLDNCTWLATEDEIEITRYEDGKEVDHA